MSLSNDLISQFVKVTKDEKTVDTGTTVYGTTVKVDGVTYVKLDGSDQLTPVTTTTNIEEDERVTVLIKDHTATVTGNVSSPAARTAEVEEIGTKITEFEILIGDKVSTKQLEAQVARIDTLASDNVTINKKLSAAEADISELDVEVAKIEELYADRAEVESLIATTIEAEIAEMDIVKTEDLEATNAKVNNLETTYATVKGELEAQKADIEKLEADQLTVEQLEGEFANIDFANIDEAAIRNFFSKSGMIENLVVGKGTIAGELVGVTIKGDLIEGGTVKADKLVVKGSDGIYYKLNFEAGTFAAGEAVPTDSLHGSVITAKSITAEKITVKDLVAFGATIGGFHITDKALYSGVKSTVGNTTQGIYLDSDGQMNVGDSQNFFKFYKDTDGKYKLAISASSIVMSTTNKDIETTIEESVNRSYDKVGSRGEQLVTNGNGLMGDNTNFSKLTFDGSVANNSPGSFTVPAGTRINPVTTDEFIALNPDKRYTLSFDMKSKEAKGTVYVYLDFYDADKQVIRADRHMYLQGTLTTLAQDLKKGDTVAYLTDVSKWTRKEAGHVLRIWNYVNSFGYAYPAETYTRTDAVLKNTGNILDEDAIDYDNNTVTLKSAWTGNTIPAGTQVSQGKSGSTYKYVPTAVNTIPPTNWKTYSGVYSGVDYSGTNKSEMFPPGAAYVKLGFLWNYNSSSDQLWVTNITLQDTTADNDLSNRLTSAEKRITNSETKITQADNKIALCATKTEVTSQISTAVNDIEVGGRNLLIKNNIGITNAVIESTNHIVLSNIPSGNSRTMDLGLTLEPGTYTFNGIKTLEDGTVSKQYRLLLSVNPGAGWTYNSYYDHDGFGYYHDEAAPITFTITESAKIGICVVYHNSPTQIFSGLKLEKGNKATDWTPAPEDTMSTVDDKINKLEIGGRNLLLNSNVEVSNNEYNMHGYAPSSPLVEGEEYTFSICFTPAPGVTQLRGYLSSGYIVLGRIDVTSTERQTAHFTFTANYADGRTPDVNAIYGYFNIFRFPNDGTVTENTTIHWVKCEKGNKATDWTPAPEDIDANIEDNAAAANENIEKAKQDAIDTSQSNMDETLKGYSTTTEVQKLISDTKGELELTDNQFSVRFEATERSIGDINGTLDPMLKALEKHFDFSLEKGIVISSGPNDISLRLDNGLIIFEKNGQQFGWWDGVDFHTGNIFIDVTERAQFGNFAFVPRKNGSLSLLKVGG